MSSGEVSVNLMCLYKSWCKLIQFSSPPRKDSDMTFNNHWNHELQPGRVPNNHNSCTTWVTNGSWFMWTADSHVIVCGNWVCDGIFTIHKASFARRASSMHKGRSTNIKRTLLRCKYVRLAGHLWSILQWKTSKPSTHSLTSSCAF